MLSSMEVYRTRLLNLEARIMDLERSLSALRAEQGLAQEKLDAYNGEKYAGHSELWRAIAFVDPLNTIMPYEQRQHIWNAWIQRSGTYPLSINIEINNEDHAVSTDPLAMASGRWEHLKPYVPASFLPKLDGPMPMLRSLDSIVYAGSDVFCLL
ncbi:hypothetical protein B0H12DRAFT_1239557 [Mycena haematopus]|nr:hypothetical protein B0H12DRAFT_1239557 [Mycena haematopus]